MIPLLITLRMWGCRATAPALWVLFSFWVKCNLNIKRTGESLNSRSKSRDLHRVNTRDYRISQKYVGRIGGFKLAWVERTRPITHNMQAGNGVGSLRYENIHGVSIICFNTLGWNIISKIWNLKYPPIPKVMQYYKNYDSSWNCEPP